jgi:hypothetical protein
VDIHPIKGLQPTLKLIALFLYFLELFNCSLKVFAKMPLIAPRQYLPNRIDNQKDDENKDNHEFRGFRELAKQLDQRIPH